MYRPPALSSRTLLRETNPVAGLKFLSTSRQTASNWTTSFGYSRDPPYDLSFSDTPSLTLRTPYALKTRFLPLPNALDVASWRSAPNVLLAMDWLGWPFVKIAPT